MAHALLLLAAVAAQAAPARTIVEDWAKVAMPPAPAVQPVTVDHATTALLVLDMLAATCTDAARPRCVATVPQVRALLDRARASGMPVIYGAGAASSTVSPEPVAPLKPQAGEPTVRASVDKFLGSDLEQVLARRGIRTVIVTGTSAEGAVLYTASGAALRGMDVVVPTDGLSAAQPFAEAYTLWHLKNAPKALSQRVTLSRSDLITVR